MREPLMFLAFGKTTRRLKTVWHAMEPLVFLACDNDLKNCLATALLILASVKNRECQPRQKCKQWRFRQKQGTFQGVYFNKYL